MRLTRVARLVLPQVGLAAGAVGAMLLAAEYVRPIYSGRAPVVERLIGQSWRDSAAIKAPWTAARTDVALATAQFEADRLAFAQDLFRTGNVTSERADSLAGVAVREAYLRRVPPALVLGVMMVENPELESRARSSVGAVGLMQVYPRVWVRALGRFFGKNLRDDETNLRYGVYILSHMIYRPTGETRPADGVAAVDSTIRTSLLRYNGCVRGTNTPNCGSYPDWVRARVERFAVALCGGRGFERCVTQPLQLSLEEGNARHLVLARNPVDAAGPSELGRAPRFVAD